MKIYKFLIVLVFLFFYNCQKNISEINFINLYTTTITSVKCENLKKAPSVKNVILSDEENDKLLNNFSKLKPAPNGLNIDARVYGSIYDGSKKLDFCSGIGVIEINNKKYLVDKYLRDNLITLTQGKR
ncbi:hypothetical protein [Chryseobacterium taiwanense]|uniref:Uncharacterized protein n=1 Tax=Chryseobacterium taiwanense TaxID=363331 RepID=A0A0B4D5W6_9FLAO|nr:hypothetical protein [Chryseobacterium taiwanense]KIC62101.1 hypothetical protein RM51_13625 [Chryseobacterium taiwanense]